MLLRQFGRTDKSCSNTNKINGPIRPTSLKAPTLKEEPKDVEAEVEGQELGGQRQSKCQNLKFLAYEIRI